MNCKGQVGGHQFPYTGSDCLDCGINQVDLSYPKKKTATDAFQNILARARGGGKKKDVQATYHQELAVETAEMLGDMRSIGIYMRMFKKYDRTDLIECRNWVMEKGKGKNKGRLFVSVFNRYFKS